GVPFHVILRGILNAGSFAEALAAITDANRCSSGNYLIASADGQMADVEGRPDGYDVIEPSDDMVWHANTFCGGLPAGQDRGLEAIPDSPVRTARIEELLRPVHGTLDVPTIAELLRDKQGAPSAICRAVDPAYPAVEQMSTMGSFIIDLAASTMHVAPGAPDELSHTPVTPGFAGRSLAR
ncbi:MAG: isopenicillin-N N-acyltransferase like protein, partial [Solirubrobacteraceae bacterium]|nr:isopenicillin-N N-acyltransferase like protein [Solirubrobacteraceae bacterium]